MADITDDELARLRRIEEAARRLSDAGHACNREAERPSESQSRVPVVRLVTAMADLRAALAVPAQDVGEVSRG